MKHIKLYESYIREKYMTYDDLGNWGKYSNESEIEDDLRMKMIRLFQYASISNHLDDVEYTDQSSDKGIKWQIKIKGKGTDIIHVYKTDKYKGSYEFYLNKKKSSEYDIQQHFLNKYVPELDQYLAAVKGYDSTYQYSDDSRAYKRGQNQAQNLKDLYDKLSSSDKKKAHKAYVDATKNNVDFKTFGGA
jgi:hypothetical protein